MYTCKRRGVRTEVTEGCTYRWWDCCFFPVLRYSTSQSFERLYSERQRCRVCFGFRFSSDVHAFIFTHDGEYIDCVFYKNPVLAGKSVRLQGTTLFIDLHMLPARAGFIVITLAVYSGGTLASLTKCCTQVRRRALNVKDCTSGGRRLCVMLLSFLRFPPPLVGQDVGGGL